VGDVILVHGTTQAAVGWQRLIQELTRRDHRAVAVDLHGAEPSSSIAELAGLCRSQVPADVESPVVVAHSGSGILLPAIAQLVDALHEVYLAAAVPDPTGQLSFLDEMQADPAAMFNPEWFGVDPTADPVLATYFLFHDCDLTTLRWALGTLRLFSALRDCYAEVPPRRDLSARPSTAVVPTKDRTLRPAYMAEVARARLGTDPVELSAGHCPHVSHPDQVADLLEPLVRIA
jgi:pimeloyl-ACP methyl ester carboxylesterase